MIDLPKFNEFFDSFKEDFAKLVKQVESLATEKTRLEQSNVSLGAKQKFLKQSITTLKQELEVAHEGFLARQKEEEAKLDTIFVDIKVSQSDLSVLEKQIKNAAQELQATKDSQAKAISEHATKLKELSSDLQGLNQRKAKAEADLSDLQTAVTTRELKLSSLQDAITEKADEAERINTDIAAAKSAFKDLQKQASVRAEKLDGELQAARTELHTQETKLQEVKVKHDKFLAYEKKAVKALEAREIALLKQEDELNQALSRAQRNKSVLNNLNQ